MIMSFWVFYVVEWVTGNSLLTSSHFCWRRVYATEVVVTEKGSLRWLLLARGCTHRASLTGVC